MTTNRYLIHVEYHTLELLILALIYCRVQYSTAEVLFSYGIEKSKTTRAPLQLENVPTYYHHTAQYSGASLTEPAYVHFCQSYGWREGKEREMIGPASISAISNFCTNGASWCETDRPCETSATVVVRFFGGAKKRRNFDPLSCRLEERGFTSQSSLRKVHFEVNPRSSSLQARGSKFLLFSFRQKIKFGRNWFGLACACSASTNKICAYFDSVTLTEHSATSTLI